MKVIIVGGRDLIVPIWLIKLIFQKHRVTPTEIVSGACGLGEDEYKLENCRFADGIDGCGERWAMENGLKLIRFPAKWSKHKKAAGPIRNSEMANAADILLLIWDGKSKGALSMKNEMEKRGKLVIDIVVDHRIPHKRIKKES